MKLIPYILYLYLLALHMTILSEVTTLYSATIDMAALLVAMVAFYKSESTTVWFALAVGILAGTQRSDLMPWHMASLTVLGVIINQISTKINLESSTSRLLIMAGMILFHEVLITLVISTSDFFTMLYKFILPSTVYTILIGWLFFQFKDDHINWQKIKALF